MDIYNSRDSPKKCNWSLVKIAAVQEICVRPDVNSINGKYDLSGNSFEIQILGRYVSK